MPPRKPPVKRPATKKTLVNAKADSDDSISSLSSSESPQKSNSAAGITEPRKKEFLVKWSQLMLEYNMNLNFEPLTAENRRSLEAVVKPKG